MAINAKTTIAKMTIRIGGILARLRLLLQQLVERGLWSVMINRSSLGPRFARPLRGKIAVAAPRVIAFYPGSQAHASLMRHGPTRIAAGMNDNLVRQAKSRAYCFRAMPQRISIESA
jgi:hypothetical protein